MRSIRSGRPLPRLSPRRPSIAAALGLALAAWPVAAVVNAMTGGASPSTPVELAAEPTTPRTPTLPAGNGGGAWWT